MLNVNFHVFIGSVVLAKLKKICTNRTHADNFLICCRIRTAFFKIQGSYFWFKKISHFLIVVDPSSTYFFRECTSDFLSSFLTFLRSHSIFNSFLKTTSCATIPGYSVAPSYAQCSLTALAEHSLFLLQLLDFLPLESGLFTFLPRPGPLELIIYFMSYMSLGMSCLILEEEGHPFQVVRKENKIG